MPYHPHFDKPMRDGVCTNVSSALTNLATVACTKPVRMVMFRNFEKLSDFVALDLRIFNLEDDQKVFGGNDVSIYGKQI